MVMALSVNKIPKGLLIIRSSYIPPDAVTCAEEGLAKKLFLGIIHVPRIFGRRLWMLV
jgi:hypothetical protein